MEVSYIIETVQQGIYSPQTGPIGPNCQNQVLFWGLLYLVLSAILFFAQLLFCITYLTSLWSVDCLYVFIGEDHSLGNPCESQCVIATFVICLVLQKQLLSIYIIKHIQYLKSFINLLKFFKLSKYHQTLTQQSLSTIQSNSQPLLAHPYKNP